MRHRRGYEKPVSDRASVSTTGLTVQFPVLLTSLPSPRPQEDQGYEEGGLNGYQQER